MVNTIINSLIAGVVGAVAFIAVRALILATGTAACGDSLSCNATSGVIAGDCGSVYCQNATANATHCSGVGAPAVNTTFSLEECWSGAECAMMVTILPLAIAIVVIAGLFIGLTRVRGV